MQNLYIVIEIIKDSVIAIYQSLLPTLSWTHNLDHIIGYIDNYINTWRITSNQNIR